MNNNENNQEQQLLLWETEFFALSVVSGVIESYTGVLIEATTLQEAMKISRDAGMDYLQFTGGAYESQQDYKVDKEFYQKLTNPHNIVGDMDYDQFCDWLDLATCVEDLQAARREFEKAKGLEEYIKVIDAQIKLKYDKENNQEKGGKEEAS